MTSRRFQVATPVALALALLVGCGTPGAPQPPSLNLPQTVEDLRAVRHGDKVTLTWTPPHNTTDKQRIRRPGATRICRNISPDPRLLAAQPGGVLPMQGHCEKVVADVLAGGAEPSPDAGKRPQTTFEDTLPADQQQQHALSSAVYAVEALNASGRSAGWSNTVAVPLAPTLPPLVQIKGDVAADGVHVSASGRQIGRQAAGLTFMPHLYRNADGTSTEVDLGTPSGYEQMGQAVHYEFIDRTAEWEKTYVYRVAFVTTVVNQGAKIEIRGESTQPVEVFVHDIFPPAAPAGVQAVFTATGAQRFIDLTWSPDTESDLAGYNVYRREPGGVSSQMNAELQKSPSFRDPNVVPGHTYRYAIAAVDLRGNQSASSNEASETAPAQP